jgi:hypothetical protein
LPSEQAETPLSPKQAASVIGKSEQWLYLARKKRNGQSGPPWYLIGGRILYLKSELTSWFRRQRHS